MCAGSDVAFAELYDAAFGWNPADEVASLNLIWQHTLAIPLERVCDVGAGTGRFSIALARCGLHCTAVEPDMQMASVLQRKLGRMPFSISSHIRFIHSRFEDVEPIYKFDSIIAMTDTLSYISSQHSKHLTERAHIMLNRGGVMILDVGLWTNNEGEIREETWAVEVENGQVNANCRAMLVKGRKQTQRNDEIIRLESLSFEGWFDQLRVYASRESTLQAFTFDSVCSLCEEAGFEHCLSVIPGTQEIVDEVGSHQRLLMAFRK